MLQGNKIFVPTYQRAYSWETPSKKHTFKTQTDTFINDLEDYFIVSKINLETEENMVSTEIEGISVKVSKSDGEKCERCWKYDELGTDSKHLDVCPRCAKVLNS